MAALELISTNTPGEPVSQPIAKPLAATLDLSQVNRPFGLPRQVGERRAPRVGRPSGLGVQAEGLQNPPSTDVLHLR